MCVQYSKKKKAPDKIRYNVLIIIFFLPVFVGKCACEKKKKKNPI
jgi:hypothetical protein